MPTLISQLERLIQINTPALVAVWLGYSDPRPILKWIERKSIPKVRIAKVEALLAKKGVPSERIIRRRKG